MSPSKYNLNFCALVSLGKALDVFDLDHSKWHELATDRCAAPPGPA